MGLNIYSSASPSAVYSAGGTFTAPLTIVQDGKYGGTTQKKLYLRNNDGALWFSGTTIAMTADDVTLINGSKNITWKLSAGNIQPTDDQWVAISTANTIALTNIGAGGAGDTSTYLPFWLRVEVPRDVAVQTDLGIKLTIASTSNVV